MELFYHYQSISISEACTAFRASRARVRSARRLPRPPSRRRSELASDDVTPFGLLPSDDVTQFRRLPSDYENRFRLLLRIEKNKKIHYN